MAHRQTPQVVRSWFEAVMDEAEEKLNDWERNFMAKIQWKVENYMELTENQYNKLEEIYAEKTS